MGENPIQNPTENITSNEIIIVYDLPSENQIRIKNPKLFSKIRSLRVTSIFRLHSFGVQCTESVVVAPKSKLPEIKKAISEIEKNYDALEKEFNIIIGTPIIKILELYNDQSTQLKVLAERKLVERLDKAIERITELLSEIDEITDKKAKKKLLYNVNKQQREYERIEKMAKELGIEVTGKFNLLFSLIEDVKKELNGGEL